MRKKSFKSEILVCISVFSILSMCACGSKDKAHEDTKTTNKETETTLAQTETTKDLSEKSKSTGNTDSSKFIEWKYDITHDGVDDTIKVSIDPANYQSLEEPRFEVYSGKTEKKIWEKDISSSHMGFDGLYLYNDGEKDHLLEWQPGMYQGNAVYSYKIFDLSETGEQNVIETDNIGFSVKENRSDGRDSSVLGTFIDKVN